jgi:hypothetical protein
MIITAKFASVCPCCAVGIEVGSKVEWSRGDKARHVACAASSSRVSRATSTRSSGYRSDRGRWNGCSCGAREMPDGSVSANACASCRYDAE